MAKTKPVPIPLPRASRLIVIDTIIIYWGFWNDRVAWPIWIGYITEGALQKGSHLYVHCLNMKMNGKKLSQCQGLLGTSTYQNR